MTLRGAALEEYPSAQTALEAMPFRMPFIHNIYTSLSGSTHQVARQVVPVTAVVDSDEGPVELRVPDASAHETHNPSLEFELKLDRAADWPVTLAYATRHLGRGVEGAATPGLDYEERSGTLTFAPGETQMTVSVPVVDDTVEDTGETFAPMGAQRGRRGASGRAAGVSVGGGDGHDLQHRGGRAAGADGASRGGAAEP